MLCCNKCLRVPNALVTKGANLRYENVTLLCAKHSVPPFIRDHLQMEVINWGPIYSVLPFLVNTIEFKANKLLEILFHLRYIRGLEPAHEIGEYLN